MKVSEILTKEENCTKDKCTKDDIENQKKKQKR